MFFRIKDLSFDGRGVCFLEDGKPVFVPYALPGDLIQAELVLQKADYATAKILEVTEPSVFRCESVCPYIHNYRTKESCISESCISDECGGCPLICMSYSAQLEYKQKLFEKTMYALSKDVKIKDAVIGSQFAYRSRFRFRYSATDNKRCLSLYEQKTHKNICINSCAVADRKMNDFISRPPKINIWELEEGQLSCITTDEGVLFDDRIGHITVSSCGQKHVLPVSNKVFFQSNQILLPFLIEEVVSYIKDIPNIDSQTVADFYSGVGTFSAFLEDSCHIVAVEMNKDCLFLAKSHLKNTSFYTRPVEKILQENFKFKPIAVIVDPPRMGLEKNVPALLTSLGAKYLIYVSCYLPTLARDLERLKNLGWKIEQARMFDFYPNTAHLECVVMIKHCQGSR